MCNTGSILVIQIVSCHYECVGCSYSTYGCNWWSNLWFTHVAPKGCRSAPTTPCQCHDSTHYNFFLKVGCNHSTLFLTVYTHVSPSGSVSCIDLALVSNLLPAEEIIPPLTDYDHGHSGLQVTISWKDAKRCKLRAAELAEDMSRIQGLYLGYGLQNWLRIWLESKVYI